MKEDEIYPLAKVEPLLDHSDKGTLEQKKRIILHITDGSTARSAINTFQASVRPKRKSAHFVIDRAPATVYQLLPISDKGWHATEANSDSVAIEHAGKLTTELTPDQIEQSAHLIIWLCKRLNISLTRACIRTHYEASSTARRQHHMCMPSEWADKIVNRAIQLEQKTEKRTRRINND